MGLLESVVWLAVVGAVVFTAAYQGTVRALRTFVGESAEASDGDGSVGSDATDFDWLKRS